MENFSIIIPARLASTRFPKKIIYDIFGLPMIEHVRRRALLIRGIKDVIVATCDEEIFKIVKKYEGHVVMTSPDHINGTHRIAEAAKQVDSENIILLQGDEPCIEPQTINKFIDFIGLKKSNFYNVICPIVNNEALYDISSVKCALENEYIKSCFRKSPYITDENIQKQYVYKMLGIMNFKKNFLLNINKLVPSKLSEMESIEQLQLIDNHIDMRGFVIDKDYPSINNISDLEGMNIELEKKDQKQILSLILNN